MFSRLQSGEPVASAARSRNDSPGRHPYETPGSSSSPRVRRSWGEQVNRERMAGLSRILCAPPPKARPLRPWAGSSAWFLRRRSEIGLHPPAARASAALRRGPLRLDPDKFVDSILGGVRSRPSPRGVFSRSPYGRSSHRRRLPVYGITAPELGSRLPRLEVGRKLAHLRSQPRSTTRDLSFMGPV